MKTIKRFLKLTAMTATVLTAVLSASCESSGDSLDNIEIPEYVERPVKAVKYEQSAQFMNDIDALNQLAFVLKAMNWNYWMMASDGLHSLEDFFTVDPEELGKSQPKLADEYLEMLTYLYENLDKYEKAVENLGYNGVFTPNVTTRGIIPLADGIDFGIACKTSAAMGRKTVMAIIRLGGWSADAQMLTKLYNQIPAAHRRGYSDAMTFWQDFSAGKLDSRSNQIFKNLYTVNDNESTLKFRDKCEDLGISPETNMSIVTQKMAQSGINLIVDACPINVGTGIDIYNTSNATMDVFTNSLKFSRDKNGKLVYEGFNVETFKNFAQQWGHNAVKYGRDFEKMLDKVQNKFNKVKYTNWDVDKDWWIENVFQDFYEIGANEAMFSDNFREAFCDGGKQLGIQTIVKVKEINGQPMSCVYIYDPATGKVRLGFILDEEGNMALYGGEEPGTKSITVVNRQTGKRVTKKVEIEKDRETIVEMDLDYDEELLEEEPKNGELTLYPGTRLTDDSGEGGSNRFTIVTNYLYYKAKADVDWITTSIASDANFLYVKLTKNDKPANPADKNSKPEARKGHVTVMATNKEGKVLKHVTLEVLQKPYIPQEDEDFITVSDGTLEFSADKGEKEVEVTLSNRLTTWWCYPDDKSIGWLSAEPYEYVESSGLYAGLGHWMIKISVNPNTTGEERRGTIRVIASRTDDVFAAEKNGEAVTTDIMVIQKAGEEEFEIRDVRNIGILFGVHTTGYYTSDNRENGNYDIYDDLQVTKSEKTLTIKGKTSDYKSNGRDDITFSITVDFSTPKAPAVTNLEIESNGYRTQSYREIKCNVDWSLKASYIPLEKIWNYGGTRENYVFHATEADGLKITSYSRSEEYVEGDKVDKKVKNLSLSSNPENSIGVTIAFD